ncbi:transposase [Gaiella occulta]|uniref:Mutator family transposase n=2 Tax=Gaiella occulta TaxID=1002870 RepID=A0A7M2YSK7_9ACTN|nr:transposase [Gaiella occulta]
MVEHTMDVSVWLRKQLQEAHPDLLRAMVKEMAEAMMSADADAVCGAGYGERSPERVNRRNGYREREWDTRVGSIELAVPKLREGSYFPDWLLQPRRRAEQAFVSVIADAYLAGVSTRRVEKLVQQLGVERMSKSQVSRLAKSLDQIVEDFRSRPLDGAPYAYVTLDALVVKCREGGRTVNVCVVHAVGVNRDGFRESLGLDVVTSEDGAAWLAFLRSLVARGLSGVQLVTSDAHPGLVDAIAATLPGAAWQRCRTHFMRNLLTRVPKSAQSFVAAMVRTIFAQPDAEMVREQHARIVDQLETSFPDAAALLAEAETDLLAFTSFPKEHWRQLWSNNSLERLNKEIRRRTDVVGIFPDRAAIIRLVGAVLAEQNDEWAVASRRYMSVESIAKARTEPPADEPKEVIAIAAAA